ncbi:MAG: FmdB family zinc ribbon protein [Terriglobia bacterium]
MPIFEYKCRDCGTTFERIVYSSSDRVACKSCDGERVDKQLSVFAVSGASSKAFAPEPDPCACGAPRRGMCGE